MTEYELVQDTINFYSGHPERRSIDENGSCMYFGPKNTNCAVGRWIDKKKLVPLNIDLDKLTNSSVSSVHDSVGGLKRILKDEIANISLECWQDLQIYHDTGLCENDSDPTYEKYLLEKYKGSN